MGAIRKALKSSPLMMALAFVAVAATVAASIVVMSGIVKWNFDVRERVLSENPSFQFSYADTSSKGGYSYPFLGQNFNGYDTNRTYTFTTVVTANWKMANTTEVISFRNSAFTSPDDMGLWMWGGSSWVQVPLTLNGAYMNATVGGPDGFSLEKYEEKTITFLVEFHKTGSMERSGYAVGIAVPESDPHPY